MCSYKVLISIVLSTVTFTVSVDVDRIISDPNLLNTQGIEENNPSGFRLTKLLDIRLNGKSDILESNLEKLIGSDKTKNIDENYSKVLEFTNNDIHLDEFRKEMNKKLTDIVNAIREINSEMVKIKPESCNSDSVNDKRIIGSKTTDGVEYKSSLIKNRKTTLNNTYPKSCKEIFVKGNNISGIYEIQPKLSKQAFAVLCDMETKGGGWTTIQKRYDGSQDFYLDWRNYKFGFGDLDGEFWIGLENIYRMTAQDGSELLVDLEDREGTKSYALYTSFKVGPEKEGYFLSALDGYSGNASDALKYHLGMKFSTKDFDQDKNSGNCAVLRSGAWWYNDCMKSNLNGKYLNLVLPKTYEYEGLHWTVNYSKVDGVTNNDIHIDESRKEMNQKLTDIVNAIREINSKIVKIKPESCNNETVNDKRIIGSKTTVGVEYKSSLIKNTKTTLNNTYPKSCREIFDTGINDSGVYKIQPKFSKQPFVVLCDMQTKGGGWTTIQKRYDGSQDFYLDWRDYKFGFGDLEGEFWIGLENIYKMTAQDGSEILVDLEDREGNSSYALYTSFKIGPENEGYPLSAVDGYSGDAGDALTYHSGMKFTTKDFDQDESDKNCAIKYSGAWWYNDCYESNLNGKYLNLKLKKPYEYQGLHWNGIQANEYSFSKSRMLIRPKQ